MRVLVVGAGTTGGHAARAIIACIEAVEVTVFDLRRARAESIAARCGPQVRALGPTDAGVAADVVVLCSPSHTQPRQARAALEAGAAVVSMADATADVAALLALDGQARARGLPVIVGAGFSPGLSCLLARHAAASFDSIDEVHVAKTGTGGPACARVHHAALSGTNLDWRDGAWVSRSGGSGRQLAWFPDPIGARDCYRAALADTLLLQRVFPTASRLTARMSATRRDRLTSWLPMLRPPHTDGGPGGIRVEVWGSRGIQRDVMVYGVADHPARASAIVAAVTVASWARGELPRSGAWALGELPSVAPFLADLDRFGMVLSIFEGAT